MGESSASAAGASFPITAPTPGAAAELAAGVLHLGLPGPGAAGVHAYALAHGDGWTLVDTGLAGPEGEAAWTALLAGPLGGRPVRQIIATSADPASVGAAGWLCAQTGAPLVMTPVGYLTARVRAREDGPSSEAARAAFAASLGLKDAGAPGDWPGFSYGEDVGPLPGAVRYLEDGAEITLGDQLWRVLVGGGAAAGPACLWAPAAQVFLAGAQIDPEGGEVVAVTPREPQDDPLGAFLAALWRIMAVIPDDVVVGPLRGPAFRGLHARLDATIAEREARLEKAGKALKGQAAADVAKSLGLAGPAGAAEARAYLNHLARKGEASVQGAAGAALRYKAQKPASAA